MTRNIAICALMCAAAIVIAVSACRPEWFSDKNEFMRHFVNQELLALLGIIMTITLASAASLHLEFNKIEERFKKRGLHKTRRGVVQGAYCLIGLFFVSVLIVVIKPIAGHGDVSEALFNGASLVIVLWNLLILVEITQLAFAIQPDFDD